MKKVLSLLTSLVMAASLTAALPASATSYFENDSVTTATAVSLNTTYGINYGTDASYETDFYVKVTLPSNGYVSITANRPIIDQEYKDMAIEIYNSQGTLITKDRTNTVTSAAVNFRTGLKKGTYYVNILNSFSTYDEENDVTTLFRVDFTADNYCEMEPNDGITTATPIALGKTYKGFVEPDGEYDDYYKFVVPTTRKVRIYIGNYQTIQSNNGWNTFFDLFKAGDTYETRITSYTGPYSYNSSVYKFNLANNSIKVASNGTGYIDKYLTAGTYYLVVTSFLDFNAAYSINVSNMPASSTVTPVPITKPTSNKPAQVTGLKLKKGGKQTAKIVWKKVSGAKGYQVKYSTTKKFKKAKTTTKNVKAKKITLKKLKKNKYFVKVRAYKKVNGKKVYGAWSSILKLYRL